MLKFAHLSKNFYLPLFFYFEHLSKNTTGTLHPKHIFLNSNILALDLITQFNIQTPLTVYIHSDSQKDTMLRTLKSGITGGGRYHGCYKLHYDSTSIQFKWSIQIYRTARNTWTSTFRFYIRLEYPKLNTSSFWVNSNRTEELIQSLICLTLNKSIQEQKRTNSGSA